jgi:single-stranded DNA-binding protein
MSMTAQTSLYGRLTVDPQPHQTRTGTAMTSAKLAVDLPCKEDPEGKATWWVSLVAFGKQAELLAGHHRCPTIYVFAKDALSELI